MRASSRITSGVTRSTIRSAVGPSRARRAETRAASRASRSGATLGGSSSTRSATSAVSAGRAVELAEAGLVVRSSAFMTPLREQPLERGEVEPIEPLAGRPGEAGGLGPGLVEPLQGAGDPVHVADLEGAYDWIQQRNRHRCGPFLRHLTRRPAPSEVGLHRGGRDSRGGSLGLPRILVCFRPLEAETELEQSQRRRELDRLGEEAVVWSPLAPLAEPIGHLLGTVGRNLDDRQARSVLRPQSLGHCPAVHTGHRHVDEPEVGAFVGGEGESGRVALGDLEVEPERCQQIGEQAAMRGVVVDQEDRATRPAITANTSLRGGAQPFVRQPREQ